jgi:hypothetical protein
LDIEIAFGLASTWAEDLVGTLQWRKEERNRLAGAGFWKQERINSA